MKIRAYQKGAITGDSWVLSSKMVSQQSTDARHACHSRSRSRQLREGYWTFCITTFSKWTKWYDENQSISKRSTGHAILSLVRLSSSPAPLRQRLGAGADIERGSHADGMGAEVQGAHAAAGQTHIRHAGGTVGRGKEFKSELWFKLQVLVLFRKHRKKRKGRKIYSHADSAESAEKILSGRFFQINLVLEKRRSGFLLMIVVFIFVVLLKTSFQDTSNKHNLYFRGSWIKQSTTGISMKRFSVISFL